MLTSFSPASSIPLGGLAVMLPRGRVLLGVIDVVDDVVVVVFVVVEVVAVDVDVVVVFVDAVVVDAVDADVVDAGVVVVAGINMRYVGRVAELSMSPHVKECAEIEMIARCCKRILFVRCFPSSNISNAHVKSRATQPVSAVSLGFAAHLRRLVIAIEAG